MPAFTATAPGKIILFGEHAVVYGRPAIAAPVGQVRARVNVIPEPMRPDNQVHIVAPAVGVDEQMTDLHPEAPLRRAVELVQAALGAKRYPAVTLRISSTIPVASGLGSGAAVSVALIRALSAFWGMPLPVEQVSALAYEVEKLHHGTPSGIDNTVIAYETPVVFRRGRTIERLQLPGPLTVVIGNTGITSPTALAVGDLRKAWQAGPERYEALFDAVSQIVQAARTALENGDIPALGPLMDENHARLVDMGVSCTELDCLVDVARQAGAWGAKLSGGGRGGNMIALVGASDGEAVAQALLSKGATAVIVTTIR